MEKLSPVIVKRNELGLIEGVDYIFKDGGKRVDWFAMIPREFIVPNRINFEKRGKPVPETVEGLENRDLLILLDGFRYVFDLRGWLEFDLPIISTIESRTTTVCRIKWMPNFETEFQVKTTTAEGDATLESTRGFGFLGPISENRAFCRCVRAFLKIPVLGKDELDNNQQVNFNNNNFSLGNQEIIQLERLMKTKKITFEILKEKLINEGNTQVINAKSIEDFPKDLIFNIIERLLKKKSN